jgi:tetratricopeptide (TPR) repeat protein/tRNA A-37 threonylcarbamoyl transferase component Bud32
LLAKNFMADERTVLAAELFKRAVDRPVEQRSAFLNEACAHDVELRREVESLLKFNEDGDQFLEESAVDVAVESFLQAALKPDQCIGNYKIGRHIGSGGMGEVYLAHDENLNRRVALKLVRFGIGGEETMRHFRREAQILASLNHPNIAQLYGAEITPDGFSFLVMEYVEGVRIDEYCGHNQLSIRDRLEMFRRVCSAVHYAHQRLIIHRDIKPANILITEEGQPKLLDFGIAKLLGSETSMAGEQTVTFAGAMTPEYASPEQVRGEAMTTASDTYSLGVILYELLTGQRPYRIRGRNPAEIARAITEQEPTKPSTAIARGDRNLKSEISNLKSLKGDLDNIVLKAMRKEPQRRYASVEQFSDDIRRHLANLPVTARPDTPGYRTAKFVRRHKAGVAAAAAAFIILTAGIAATVWQAHLARQQRDHARLEQAKADGIKSFLTDMLTYSSPEYISSNPTKNKDAKVSEVLNEAAKRAETELADQPEVLVEVQKTIGGVYAAQGRYDQAEKILRAAREKSIHLYGTNSHQNAEVSGTLANALLGKGNYAEADELFRQNIEIERGLAAKGRGNGKDLARALAAYGGMLDQRQDRAAESYLREALKYSSAFTSKERVFVAMLYNDLSNEALYRGDQEESEHWLRGSLDEYRKLPAGTYVEMAVTLSNLGALLIAKGKYDEAEPLVLEGLALRRKVLGNAHTSTAGALFRLSDLRYRQGRYTEAEKAAQESIEIFKRALATPQDSTLFTNPVLEMGMILDKIGRLQEAETRLRQALDIRTRLLPKGNLGIAKAEGALGECLTAQKRYAEAEPLLLDSYDGLRSRQGEKDPRVIEALDRLVKLYEQIGNTEALLKYRTLLARQTQ